METRYNWVNSLCDRSIESKQCLTVSIEIIAQKSCTQPEPLYLLPANRLEVLRFFFIFEIVSSKWIIFHPLNYGASDEDHKIHYSIIYNYFNMMCKFLLAYFVWLNYKFSCLCLVRNTPNENKKPGIYCINQRAGHRWWGAGISWNAQKAGDSALWPSASFNSPE